jgi:hypothetical protein
VWLLVGENIVPLISESGSRYTPGRSFAALASGERSGDVLLGMGSGAVASVLWAAAFVSFGLLVFLGRDV